MSDLMPHARDDLHELPNVVRPRRVLAEAPAMSDIAIHKLCSCQLGICSPYICECNPRRSLIAALIDISAARDVPLSALGYGNVVQMKKVTS